MCIRLARYLVFTLFALVAPLDVLGIRHLDAQPLAVPGATGLDAQQVRDPQAPGRRGDLIVTNVWPGSPAEAQGMRVGDIITHLDGTPVRGRAEEEVLATLEGTANTRAELTVRRQGEATPLLFRLVRASARGVVVAQPGPTLPPVAPIPSSDRDAADNPYRVAYRGTDGVSVRAQNTPSAAEIARIYYDSVSGAAQFSVTGRAASGSSRLPVALEGWISERALSATVANVQRLNGNRVQVVRLAVGDGRSSGTLALREGPEENSRMVAEFLPGAIVEELGTLRTATHLKIRVRAQGWASASLIEPAEKGAARPAPVPQPTRPLPATPRPPAVATSGSHTVQPKDTLYSIARRYGVSVDQLRRANPQIRNDVIVQGKKVKIPVL